MSQSSDEPRVVPAQLDFLAIYNPTLSDDDDSLKDQIIFYYSRQIDRQHVSKSKQLHPAEDVEETENKKLRQIGLAQGMVNFAKNFSDSNIDTVETERSRIVLHELESDWWILASVDLTRLPKAKSSVQYASSSPGFEYSAREVAPAPLLIAQLVQANSLFLLHHSANLTELFVRVGRDAFCGYLGLYWSKFAQNWDVLLHGNPARDVYNATKLSGGGELGIGVGEEAWGSGEREVLEGFIDRTEGLQDLVVGRYGLPPETERPQTSQGKVSNDWLGAGHDPIAADGVVFSGKGLISRRSLRTISCWMEDIFKQGDNAYGVGENPSSRPRQRRKRPKTDRAVSSESSSTQETHPRVKSTKGRASNLRKKAIENHATPPGIPAPLVGQVEKSLDDAVRKASVESKQQASAQVKQAAHATASGSIDNDSSAFGADNMMKYLKLGYGTSWTLNPKGFKAESADNTAESKSKDQSSSNKSSEANKSGLQQVDPTPEVTEEEHPFQQKLEHSVGKFLIGLSGDLEEMELNSDYDDDPDIARPERRLFLRTLNVETAEPRHQKSSPSNRPPSIGSLSKNDALASNCSDGSVRSHPDPKTSAGSSVDGSRPNLTHEKVQVAVYVHQPFIFVFLFELHTPKLTMPGFYRGIHNQLGPLQKPLLQSTDPSRIASRIASAIGEKSANANSTISSAFSIENPIYDLVYDPTKLTVRTSIPNIPIPGSLAAEGLTSNASSYISVSGAWYTLGIPIGASSAAESPVALGDKLIKSAWSRTEALNAHTQLLHTYAATRKGNQIEHTVKTGRGWWVLWMKVMPSQAEVNKQKNTRLGASEHKRPSSLASSFIDTGSEIKHNEAFLVRRAADYRPTVTAQSRTISSGPGKWLLREQKRDASGASTVGGAASAKGVSDGVGVDARRWVDGLLTLTQ